jgi:hypothetical protein
VACKDGAEQPKSDRCCRHHTAKLPDSDWADRHSRQTFHSGPGSRWRHYGASASRGPPAVRDWANNPSPEWLEVRSPITPEAALEFLGVGERDAIALTLEADADALLMDERAGRQEAVRRGLRVIGTLAVLDEAAGRGLLDFETALESLRQTNFRLSPAVLRALTRVRGSGD